MLTSFELCASVHNAKPLSSLLDWKANRGGRPVYVCIVENKVDKSLVTLSAGRRLPVPVYGTSPPTSKAWTVYNKRTKLLSIYTVYRRHASLEEIFLAENQVSGFIIVYRLRLQTAEITIELCLPCTRPGLKGYRESEELD